MDEKRKVEVVVLSDIHLGTKGSRAAELLSYLKTVKPGTLILNGDIVDIWQFRKSYFPKAHLKLIKHLISLASDKCNVYYITGNHDEILRRFSGLKIGKLHLVNDIILKIGGKRIWFFHGDVFDVVMQYSKWLARIGAVGYDTLVWLNTSINWVMRKLKLEPVSFSKKIKQSVKSAVKYIHAFEESAAIIALRRGLDGIVCGHIHHPDIRKIQLENGSVDYYNSGDWIENLTSLEYNNGQWRIFNFREDFIEPKEEDGELERIVDLEVKDLFDKLVFQFNS